MTNKDTAILEALQVQPLSDEEKASKHILKRLFGPIASCNDFTRNGRKYNKELWEKALNDEIFKEKVAKKSLFLELGHPADRDETDMEKVCACIPEVPKIIDGDLYAVVDVLDSPNGHLLNNLIDYGFVPGISSRGTGDVMDNDEVDPETFFLETWDIVQVPSLKKARLSVTEGLEKPTTDINLHKALTESLAATATPKDKEMMEEAAKNLGIMDKTDSIPLTEDMNKSSSETSSQETTSTKEVKAEDNGMTKLVERLSDILADKANLETEVKNLQEQLAVSNAKAKQLEEDLNRQKSVSIKLTESATKVKPLEATISTLENTIKDKDLALNTKDDEIKRLSQHVTKDLEDASKKLQEKLSSSRTQVLKLSRQIVEQKTASDAQLKQLTEALAKEKADSNIKVEELNKSLKDANTLCEGYKKYAMTAINRYINMKATYLGVTSNEIKNRLPQKYDLDDVDRICESMAERVTRMNKMPFQLSRQANISITESQNDPLYVEPEFDDSVDDSLLRLAGLK